MNYKEIAQQIVRGPKEFTSEQGARLLMMLQKEEEINRDSEVARMMDEDMLIKVMRARGAMQGVLVPRNAVLMTLFAFSLLNTPGKAMLWLAVFKHLQTDKPCTLHDLCFAFAEGFPTESNLSDAWRAQKRSGLNDVDTQDFWL